MRAARDVAQGSPAIIGRASTREGANSRMKTAFGFALVGATGIFVNQAALWLLVGGAGMYYAIAAVVATQVSTTWNFSLNELLVFRGRDARHGLWARFLAFWAVNTGTLLLRVPLLALLVSGLHIHYLVSNLITLVVLFVARFLVSDQLIWRTAAPAATTERERTAVEGDTGTALSLVADEIASARESFAYGYDIHGFVSLASDVRLPELAYFRTDELNGGADVKIRVGDVLSGPRRRIEVREEPGVLHYQEHLGRLGANFRLEIGDEIDVTVTPMLARSPHVVYTNIVEALLRFVLASRGYALLHSATVIVEGEGVMLSAHTDTGKTATILRMLREHGGTFLSDDMTIVTGEGPVYSYPKPLTISHHTLAAIQGVLPSLRERARLRVKSTLHSKGGRDTGLRLAQRNLPIMSMNAVTQAVIPPPKYHVDELVQVVIGQSATVKHLVLIARGPKLDEPVAAGDALEQLIENTDDAYGFPPFSTLAPFVKLDGHDYVGLRERERDVIGQLLLSGVDVHRMVRDDFSWADDIPALVRDGRGVPDLAAYRDRQDGQERRAA